MRSAEATALSLIPAAWVALVLTGAWLFRPSASRLEDARPLAAAESNRGGFAVWVGGRLRALARRPENDVAAARLGRTCLVAAAVAIFDPMAAIAVAAGSTVVPRMRSVRAQRRRTDAIWRDLPDVVDLFRLAVSAGLTVRLALDAVARRTSGPIGAGLTDARDRIALGVPIGDAVMGLVATVGEPVRPLASALAGADRYGVQLDHALDRVGSELRLERRRRAEIAARRIPILLLFPLVVLVLPAFGLLTVVPVLVSTFDALGP